MRGFGADSTVAAWCTAASGLLSTLPIVPGGLGTVDGALALGLVTAGTATSAALAVVVLYRLISLVLIGTVGWVLWLAGRRAEIAAREALPEGVGRG